MAWWQPGEKPLLNAQTISSQGIDLKLKVRVDQAEMNKDLKSAKMNSGPNLEILSSTRGALPCGQAQDGIM